jgi:hypothetical protein
VGGERGEDEAREEQTEQNQNKNERGKRWSELTTRKVRASEISRMLHPYAWARKIDAAAITSATRKDGAASEPAQASPTHPPAVDEEDEEDDDEPVSAPELLPPVDDEDPFDGTTSLPTVSKCPQPALGHGFSAVVRV